MSKPPRFVFRKKLTLQGESADIADAHVYAGRQRRSLSAMFFDWLLPLIRADKQAHPEQYGDSAAASQPAGEGK